MKKELIPQRQKDFLEHFAKTKYPIYAENLEEALYENEEFKHLSKSSKIKICKRIINRLKNKGFIEWGYDHRLDRNGWVITFKGREFLKSL